MKTLVRLGPIAPTKKTVARNNRNEYLLFNFLNFRCTPVEQQCSIVGELYTKKQIFEVTSHFAFVFTLNVFYVGIVTIDENSIRIPFCYKNIFLVIFYPIRLAINFWLSFPNANDHILQCEFVLDCVS